MIKLYQTYMFYEERVVAIPLTEIEIAIPFTRRTVDILLNYSGLHTSYNNYPIITTFVREDVNKLSYYNNPTRILDSNDISKLKIGPVPTRRIDHWFPVRLRAI